jgi:HemY protein
MVKFIFGLLFIVIIVLLAVLFVKDDPGFVLIKYADFSLETSLAFGVVAVAVAGLVIQILFRILLAFLHLPRTMGKSARNRRMEKSRRMLNQGLIDLAEGRFQQSEANLVKMIEHTENPLINYLAAARAAQQLERYDERDDYLKKAHEASPDADVAIGVTQAELQLASGQTERALATLNHLRTAAPKHDYVLKLLAKVYFQIEEWSQLCDLIPEVRRKKLFPEEKLTTYEFKAFNGYLETAAKKDQGGLDKAWSKLPRALQTNSAMILRYIDLVNKYEHDTRQVQQIIVKAISQQWDNQLVNYYGQLKVEDTSSQLATAEKWLKEYGSNDALLLALGRICIRLKLWGKAQSYLEASIGSRASSESCLELANLFNRNELKEPAKACVLYKRGLELSFKDRP